MTLKIFTLTFYNYLPFYIPNMNLLPQLSEHICKIWTAEVLAHSSLPSAAVGDSLWEGDRRKTIHSGFMLNYRHFGSKPKHSAYNNNWQQSRTF